MTFTCFGPTIPVARLVALAALLGGAGFSGEAWAQSITVDGRLSPAQTLAGPNYAVGAALGRQVGGNLFHSFGAFGLKGGETATFNGPASVGNVIGRVTGGAASSINGAIRSTIPGASLYLVNPAGVVFGPNASVDVGGSFHASSADYLRMKDGARFGATNPDASTLSAAPPEAFGFLSASPRPITVTGSTLQLSQGGTLGLVGGDVTISGGVLLAPGGTVHVASAAGPGEAPVDPRAGPPPTVARSGRVQVANASTIYPSGGSVFIRAGELSVSDGNTVIVTDNSIPGRNGVLSLHADRAVAIRNGATVVASATGPGRAPGISIGTAARGTVTVDSATVATNAPASGNGGPVAINTGALTLQNGAVVVSNARDRGNGGPLAISAGALTLRNGAMVVSNAENRGNGGPISVAANSVLLDGLETRLESKTTGEGLADANNGPASAGAGGTISLTGGTLSVQNRASIESNTSSGGPAGSVGIAMTGDVAVTAGAQIISNSNTGGLAATVKGGDAGAITLSAGTLTLARGGLIASDTHGSGNGGEIALAVSGALTIDGANKGDFRNGVGSEAVIGVSGSTGAVRVSAGSVSILNGGFISSNTFGTGRGNAVAVTTPGALVLDGGGDASTQIGASALGPQSGDAGTVTVSAGTAAVRNGGRIASTTAGTGQGGNVAVNTGALTLARGGSIASDTSGSGNGGEIALAVGGALTIDGANKGGFRNGVSSQAEGNTSGAAGPVRVTAGSVSVLNGGFISSDTFGTGRGNSVLVTTPGALLLDGGGAGGGGGFTQIGASSQGLQSGDAGTVTVSAGTVAVRNGAQIASLTNGPGQGGNVAVNTGALTLSRGGSITSDTSGSGNGGEIALAVGGALTIDGTDKGGFRNGVSSQAAPGSSGLAGAVRVNAGSITMLNDGFINSNASGTGVGGSVAVTTPGALVLDGGGGGFTEIAASAQGSQSGNAGTVTVSAGTAAVRNGGRIASTTTGPGRGGDVTVNTGALALARGGTITSDTFGSGNGGEIALAVGGALTIDGTDKSGLRNGVSSEAAPGSSGSAGSVRVNAGSVSVLNGGTITSSTAGTGAGGSVRVATPGALLLDGGGTAGTGITASATGLRSGDGGPVSVSAGTVTVQGGAQIASSTAGPGRGGDVTVNAASAIRLNSPGPRVSATATGTGDAGSVAVAAPQVFLRNGASISTAALEANGGNITVGPGDLLYLQQSAITTSVGGALGNGGNIAVEPQLVVLDRSVIQANAVGGNGGNVSVQAEQLVSSFNSAITATSQRGVSGEILVAAQPLNLNGSLVVLASDLRAAAALLREGCAVRGASPRSSLVAAGRGGQRQGLDATLPALYFAHRPVRDGRQPAPDASAPERISLGLSSPCG